MSFWNIIHNANIQKYNRNIRNLDYLVPSVSVTSAGNSHDYLVAEAELHPSDNYIKLRTSHKNGFSKPQYKYSNEFDLLDKRLIFDI